MVNDQLRQLCLSLSRIGTTKLAALISRYPALPVREIISKSFQDHLTFMKICGAFALKREPRFQSSLLWWRSESGLEQSRRGWGHAIPVADGILAWRRAGAAAQRGHTAHTKGPGWHR
jgi:hypothetical protein